MPEPSAASNAEAPGAAREGGRDRGDDRGKVSARSPDLMGLSLKGLTLTGAPGQPLAGWDVWRPLLRHAEAEAPREACGLLVAERDGTLRAEPADNLAAPLPTEDPATSPRDATRAFELDVRQLLAAWRRGARLVAIVHSHVDAGAYFSAEDRRLATTPDGRAPLYPGVQHVVLDVRTGGRRPRGGPRAGRARVAGLRVFAWDAARGDFVERGRWAPLPAARTDQASAISGSSVS